MVTMSYLSGSRLPEHDTCVQFLHSPGNCWRSTCVSLGVVPWTNRLQGHWLCILRWLWRICIGFEYIMKRAVITGIGVVSPFGIGWKRWVGGLQAGLCTARTISLFDPNAPR